MVFTIKNALEKRIALLVLAEHRIARASYAEILGLAARTEDAAVYLARMNVDEIGTPKCSACRIHFFALSQ